MRRFAPVFLVVSLFACISHVDAQAQWGEIDLRAVDFRTADPIALSGTWEFFWNTHADGDLGHPVYHRVPGYWTDPNDLSTGEAEERTGFATYRLVIRLPEDAPAMSLLLREVAFAYELRWNGTLLHAQGRLGTDRQSQVPSIEPVLVPVPPGGGTVELRIEVANYLFRAGWLRPPILGGTEVLTKQWTRLFAVNGLVIGIVLYMAIHRLVIALLSRERRSASLAFVAMAMVVAVRLALEDSLIVELFVPGLPWGLAMRALYLIAPLGAMALVEWFGRLYPEESVVLVRQVILVLGGVLIGFIMFSPISFSSRFILVFEFFFLGSLFYLVAVLWSALRHRSDEMWTFILGFLLLAASTVVEMSMVRRGIVNPKLSHLGFAGFLMSQNLVLTMRFSHRTRAVSAAANAPGFVSMGVDELTGIADCERMNRFLGYCQRLASRYGTPYSVILYDVDHFSELERAYGKESARGVLKRIARLLESSLRDTDLVCRRDGDTFMVALPLTPFPASRDYAERVRSILSSENHPGIGPVTVSYGLSPWLNDEMFDVVLTRAERSLATAKSAGRNRGCSHLDLRPPPPPQEDEGTSP